VYTSDVAEAHFARGDEFRQNVAAVLARHDLPVSVSGFGSMMSLHALPEAPTQLRQMAKRDAVLQERLFLGLLERGVYIAHRGMMNVGLAHTDDQLAQALDALDDTVRSLNE
jgi:glutamate-1-semialdehyde 2,1-aminomutase